MAYYTYVLRSLKDGKLYIGSTQNIDERLKQHNSGRSTATRNRRPFELIYSETFDTQSKARWRERTFKKSHDVLRRAIK